MAAQYLTNVAFVGAGGNSGSGMVAELLKTGKHHITALTREGSNSALPEGVSAKTINYENPASIVAALQGQDVLVITLSTTASPDTQKQLVEAAIEAGVQYVMPNHWAPNSDNSGLAQDVRPFGGLRAFQDWLDGQTKIKHLSLSCGFWYEWSLAIPDSYGFDFDKKTVTFFDDGLTKICTSTWPQVGRAVAALLSLPVSELEPLSGKLNYVNSFNISQRDMFDSVLRVTGDKESDWKVSYEPAQERYANGFEMMKSGNRWGFCRVMYTRVFYKDGSGDFEMSHGTLNERLGLPKENLDDATKVAIQRAKDSPLKM